jgi:uncharacterized membrane protein (GlpM family)
MPDAGVVVVKAVAGGTLVVAFALLGQGLRPKMFAGLFAAAPSIALASLIITVIDKGDHDASEAALGMMFGAAGFVVFAALVHPLLVRTRVHAVLASAVSITAWLVVAVGGYLAILR